LLQKYVRQHFSFEDAWYKAARYSSKSCEKDCKLHLSCLYSLSFTLVVLQQFWICDHFLYFSLLYFNFWRPAAFEDLKKTTLKRTWLCARTSPDR